MKARSTQTEQLDNLSLEGEELDQALKSLAWINRRFGAHRTIIRSVLKIMRTHPEKKHFHIVDLGCGGGDVMRELARELQKKGRAFSITGIDGNANALKYAQRQNIAFPSINYRQADVLSANFDLKTCDILISSHFLYHFQSEDLIRFLQKNLPKVRLAFVNSGLERNRLAFCLFKGFAFALPISRMAKEDGLLAIRRAFTKKELEGVLAKIPDLDYELKRRLLFRLETTIYPWVV